MAKKKWKKQRVFVVKRDDDSKDSMYVGERKGDICRVSYHPNSIGLTNTKNETAVRLKDTGWGIEVKFPGREEHIKLEYMEAEQLLVALKYEDETSDHFPGTIKSFKGAG